MKESLKCLVELFKENGMTGTSYKRGAYDTALDLPEAVVCLIEVLEEVYNLKIVYSPKVDTIRWSIYEMDVYKSQCKIRGQQE